MALLGIDIGTTHCKAGLFRLDGTAIRIASRPTLTRRRVDGHSWFDPDELWETAAALMQEAIAGQSDSVLAIGITSMAESGLLVDRRTGAPRSAVIPWFDTAAQPYADAIAQRIDPLTLFRKTGQLISYKASLAKLLSVRDQSAELLPGAVWLSAADYIAFRLTRAFGTDYSLAGRTSAFNIQHQRWDSDLLAPWGLSTDLFPPAYPSGTPIGATTSEAQSIGLPPGVPVAVSGHDHVCGAFAAGAVMPDAVFDSMGTAEVLIGAFPRRPLTETDYHSGLGAGCHVMGGYQYWMGGLSTSGGSVEWLRALLGDEPLSYAALAVLVESAAREPTGILYFPYLLGSGSPHTNPRARAALIGLSAAHTRAQIAKAVLEGTAYEIEFIRRAGEQMASQPIRSLTVAGGGTRNTAWLQVKADVTGCRVQVFPEAEAALLGAALAAGIGAGVYSDADAAFAQVAQHPMQVIEPDPERHAVYRSLFEQGYLPMQEPLYRLSQVNLRPG